MLVMLVEVVMSYLEYNQMSCDHKSCDRSIVIEVIKLVDNLKSPRLGRKFKGLNSLKRHKNKFLMTMKFRVGI